MHFGIFTDQSGTDDIVQIARHRTTQDCQNDHSGKIAGQGEDDESGKPDDRRTKSRDDRHHRHKRAPEDRALYAGYGKG